MKLIYSTHHSSVFSKHFGSYFGNGVLSDRFYEYLLEEKDWELMKIEGIPNPGDDPQRETVLKNTDSERYCFDEDWRRSLEAQSHPDVVSTAKELGEEAVQSENGYRYNEYDEEGLKIVEVEKSSQEDTETSELLQEIKDRGDIAYESFKDYHYIYKLKVAGQIAGVVIVDDAATEPTPTPERFQDIPHINGIFIKEEQRNNGFGTLLLDTLCKEENIESVVVDAETKLTEFYAKTYPHIVYIKRRSPEGL
jgi:GNAT superfamily N-acetyltransferase